MQGCDKCASGIRSIDAFVDKGDTDSIKLLLVRGLEQHSSLFIRGTSWHDILPNI
jgi:hypothetical protein